MSHPGHFQYKCTKCGKICGGCRCMEPGKETRSTVCEDCDPNMNPAPQAPAVPTPQETYLEALRALDLALYPHKERLFQAMRKWVGTRTPNELIALIEANMDPAGSAIASPERSAQMREPDDYRKTYREMFLDAVWNAFDERHPCFHGDCDHHIQKDCDLAIRDFARNMVERYYE